MDTSEDNDLRQTLRIKSESSSRWKKIAISFIFIAVLCFIGIIILIVITTSSNNDKEEKEDGKGDGKGDDKDKDQDDKWEWKPQGNRIKTRWGKSLDPKNVWPEYPRPQLQRTEWLNLNGEWSYSIRNKDQTRPHIPDGKILVPFPIESSLSGVMRNVTEKDAIWYEKVIEIPKEWEGKRIMLNFGAVDWKSILYINGNKVGEHTGGYTYFYFDITDYLHEGINEITLYVWDPTDRSYIPLGKQTLTPGSIWYTPSSGIWQTVWLEPLNSVYIKELGINNNFDQKTINIAVKTNTDETQNVKLNLAYQGKLIKSISGDTSKELSITLNQEDFHPWSPSSPCLYDIQIELYSPSNVLYDNITSYTAIRKIESKRHTDEQLRIFLNDEVIFNMGTLDQGFWPDGLHTAPSEEAMIFDILKLKEMGFNTIRKHIKVEPFRYYYQCDKIGMLVWQDMPAGDISGSNWDGSKIDGGADKQRSDESKNNYYKEWGEIIDNMKFFQSIIIWIPFNEGWGQFETEKAVDFTHEREPTRLINAASGGNHRVCGNFLDLHSYPQPNQFIYHENLTNVLGEYGGVGLEKRGHTWNLQNWAYIQVENSEELTERFTTYANDLIKLLPKGFGAAIYTQTTDVESEINGLITYDREIVKIFPEGARQANEKVIQSLKNIPEE